jgi:glycosyltransferase involved in cell wall biosynthesis
MRRFEYHDPPAARELRFSVATRRNFENDSAHMDTSPEISIVAPCHNEQANLPSLTAAIRAAVEPTGRSFEMVLVDDCSPDGTWALLQQLGAQDPRIRALRFEYNCGQSAALWAGMKAARGRIIITLDADMQNPPAEIPRFLDALRQADCVCGSRVEARAKGDSWVRRASSKIANSVRNKVSGETISDAGCCFRAFRRECIADVKFFKGAHRFLPTLIKMEGFTVAEISISHNPRQAGQSHYGVWNRLFKSSADLLAVRWMKKRAIRYKIAEKINA